MIIYQKPYYELIIKTNKYTGNYNRQLIGYTCGILDMEQMKYSNGHGHYEMSLFWDEEFDSQPQEYWEPYELLDNYLMETWQEVDDWEQMTFYHICGNDGTSLAIQLVTPLSQYWENIVIRRIKKFFEVNPCKHRVLLGNDAKLLDLYIVDSEGKIIKKYMNEVNGGVVE